MSNKTKRGLGILEDDETINNDNNDNVTQDGEDRSLSDSSENRIERAATPTELQRESDLITPIPNVLTDPAERVRVAVLLDTQVSAGTFIMATALHQINRHNLHKELGYDNFDALVQERYQMSVRSAQRYTQVIESLGSGERVKELMNRNSLTKLLEVSKEIRDKNKTEDNGKVFLEIDGEQVEQSEYINKLLAEEKVKVYEKVETAEHKLRSATSELESTKKEIDKKKKEIEKLQKSLTAMIDTKGLSPELITRAKNTKEAERQITDCMVTIANQFEVLENIEYELRTPRLATDIQRSISVIQGSINALEKNWLDHLEVLKRTEPVNE
ncbi:MAG: hypothetical protein IPL26_19830 [Leptospiraceae bacterium]|nr:hypothetical protein [Leptospiraceae bacterium]